MKRGHCPEIFEWYDGYVQMDTREVMNQLCLWTLNGLRVSLFVCLRGGECEYLYDGLRMCMLCY